MKFRTTMMAIVAIAVAATGTYLWWGTGSKGGDGKSDRGNQPVLVTLTQARTQEFVDLIEAVGTAKANESIELTAKSTDTVARLNFTDGQKVAAGYVVAEMTSRAQSADITAAEATLREQEQTLQRTKKLLESGFVTKASLDTARAARDSAAARVAATRSRMADRTIKSPFAGVLGLRRVSVGALVRPADVITTLDDISRIKVDFSVAETQLAGISKGQTVRASAAAEQSLVPIETRQYVYVVDAQNKAERREVKTGARVPGHVEILEGLKEGDSIVLDGTLRLRPGATIRLAGTGAKAEGEGRKERGNRQP